MPTRDLSRSRIRLVRDRQAVFIFDELTPDMAWIHACACSESVIIRAGSAATERFPRTDSRETSDSVGRSTRRTTRSRGPQPI